MNFNIEKMTKVLIKTTFLICCALSVVLCVRLYSMTSVSRISFDVINQDPLFLQKNKILYFDDFADSRLSKYREILQRHNLNKIGDIDEKVLLIVNLINNINFTAIGQKKYIYPKDRYLKDLFIYNDRAYCLDSSRLLSILLSSMSIYSRNWHFCNQNNKGFHTFIEYYNPEEKRWIIIGSYYGIQYKKDKQLLSVTDMLKLRQEVNSVKGLIVEHNIARADFVDLDTIADYWSNKNNLLLCRANDFIKRHDPEVRYGFFGKLPFFNRLPDGVKKVFRIFGRNNSLYKIVD